MSNFVTVRNYFLNLSKLEHTCKIITSSI